MINNKYIITLLISIFALYSCEKVIDVNLKDAKPVLVIEGQITDSLGFNIVSLSKTSSFYSNNPIERVTGAIVEVSDETGKKHLFDEFSPGLYNNSLLKIASNHKYKLRIVTGTDIFESFSTTSSPVKIDSVKIEISEFGPKQGNGGGHGDSSFKITAYFLDNVKEVNFYRLRLVINGEYMSGFYIVDDTFFNGKTIPFNFGGIVLEEGDEVTVELLGIDETNFNYFYTLQRLMGNGQDITPGNPPTNISGDAIGIFGVSTFDSMIEVFHIED